MPITPEDRDLFTQLCRRAEKLDRDIKEVEQLQAKLDRVRDEAWAEHDAITAIIEMVTP
jgi:hypothetical protein